MISSVPAQLSPEAYRNTEGMAVISSSEDPWWFILVGVNRTLTDRRCGKRYSRPGEPILGPGHESSHAGCFLSKQCWRSKVEGVLGRWVGCRLNLSCHGEESALVRSICRSHAISAVRYSVVSVDSALPSPCALPFYLAGHGWEAGEGLEEVGQA